MSKAIKPIKPKEYPAIMVAEAFDSLELGDKFTCQMITDMALNALSGTVVLISVKDMSKKASKFIQNHKKHDEIEVTDEKWQTIVNGRKITSKVFKKIEHLGEYDTKKGFFIPTQYHQFCDIWNIECNKFDEFKAKEFREFLATFGIVPNYEGQVSKFLWLIRNRGLCDSRTIRNDPEIVYIKDEDIPHSVLQRTGATFWKERTGRYISRMHLIKNNTHP